MLDVFGNLRLLLKRRLVVIDNSIFRLHWMFTGSLLAVFSIIITARQYVGDPIACFGVSQAPLSLLNTYCWVHATFTIEQAFGKRVGFEIPHPGIDNSRSGTKKYYPYYQWVCFVLFLQATFFYVPHYVWKIWEGGLLESVTVGLTMPILSKEERKKRVNLLTDYLKRTTGCHKWYALKYFCCEGMCLLNVLGQMFLLDRFFDGEFWRYGTEVIRFSRDNRANSVDPMVYVFPRMTKCTFYSFGYSGDVQTHDTLCILPLNVVNEKIFIFLWFWFVILSLLTFLVLISRAIVIFFPPLRRYFLHDKCKLAAEDGLAELIRDTDVGDFYMVYMLGKNLDSLIFRDVVEIISNSKKRNRAIKEKEIEAEGLPEETESLNV